MNLTAKAIYDRCPDDFYTDKNTNQQRPTGQKKATIKLFLGNRQTMNVFDSQAAQALANYANSGKKSIFVSVNLYPINSFTCQNINNQVVQYDAVSLSFPITFSSFKDANTKNVRPANTIQP